ncbi:MAG: hypothetical protein QM710_13915 [Flavobacterium sp.]
MENLPDFEIRPLGEISNAFLAKNIATFGDAVHFVAHLNYGRNANKEDLKTVFSDNCGTCSTKHALLKLLADENGFGGIKLLLGIFKMNAKNTHRVAQTLLKNHLEYLPEAHNYLKANSTIFDFTKANSKASDFADDLIMEIEMQPNQISDYKVGFHKKYLQQWLDENPQIQFDLDGIWQIREQCIRDLSNN